MWFDDHISPHGMNSVAKGEAVTLDEIAQSAYDSQVSLQNFNSTMARKEEIYDSISDDVFKVSGKRLDNPMRANQGGGWSSNAPKSVGAFGSPVDDIYGNGTAQPEHPEVTFHASLKELANKHPELNDYLGSKSADEQLRAARRAAEGRAQDISERNGDVSWNKIPIVSAVAGATYNAIRHPLNTGAAFAGGLRGMIESPADTLGLMAGFHTSAATSLLKAAALNAASNAGVQAVMEPGVQLRRKDAGLEYGIDQAAVNILGAGAIGGAIDLGIRAPARAIKKARGVEGMGGVFRDAPEPDGTTPTTAPVQQPLAPLPGLEHIPPDLTARIRAGDHAAMDEAIALTQQIRAAEPKTLPEGVTPELVTKAEGGDLEATREILTKTGELERNPAARGALLEAEMSQDMRPVIEGVDNGDGHTALLQMLRAASDPDEPLFARAPMMHDPEKLNFADPIEGRALGSNQHETIHEVEAAQAKRKITIKELDLKNTELAQGVRKLRGDVERLGDQATFDRERAGRVLAFERVDGAVEVVDGAARQALAKRFPDGETKAEAVIFKEKDGWSRKDVEREALRKNITEGQGNPLAVADAMRDRPGLLDGSIALDTDQARLAYSLSQLSEQAYASVKAGEANPYIARVVSDHVANPLDHADVLADLTKMGINDVVAARRLIPDLVRPRETGANDIMLGIDRPDLSREMPLDGGSKMDDPTGPQAKAQVQRMERDLAPEIKAAHEAGPPPPTPAERIAHVENVRKAIEELTGIIPKGLEVRAFSSAADLPAGLARQVEAANAQYFAQAFQNFLSAKSEGARAKARANMDAAKLGQGVEGIASDGAIYIAAYAVNPKGRIAHEVVHALRESGQIAPDELMLLADRSRKVGAFDTKREALYRTELEARGTMSAEQIADTLNEEAAAHLIEARANGKDFGRTTNGIIDRIRATLERVGNVVRGMGFKTADDVVSDFMAGHLAKREATRQWMRSEGVTAVAPSKDGLFAFAGERARTADHDALAKAKQMTEDGKDRTEVWTKTGWFRGVDGKWRFEIDDSGMSYKDGASSTTVLDPNGPIYHPEVGAAYPESGGKRYTSKRLEGPDYDNVRAVAGATDSTGIRMVATPDNPYSPSVALHELQHDVQRSEGFARGGDPDEFTKSASFRIPFTNRTIGMEWGHQAALDHYNRLAGETEARTVQARQHLTADERRARPPWLDYDVPEDQQIVRFGSGQQNSQTLFAMRDADTGQSMRRELDTLGYYSHALEVARGLKQAKGTPEQMLAQLKSAGVKQAEIEATGLDKFFEEKGRPRAEISPPLGDQREAMSAWPLGEGKEATVHLSSVESWLDKAKIPYTVERSQSNSASLGPSISTYYKVDTPSGKKTIRVSDHHYVAPDGGLDLRIGGDADDAIAQIHRLVGKDVPREVGDRLSATKASADVSNQAKDADRWQSLKPGFRDQIERWLRKNGGEQLIGNPSAMLEAKQYLNVLDKDHAIRDLIKNHSQPKKPAQFLDGKTSVTRDEIAAHLEQNRVGVNEVLRERGNAPSTREARYLAARDLAENNGLSWHDMAPSEQRAYLDEVDTGDKTKWAGHSLDPSNPTYRETVLHLPVEKRALEDMDFGFDEHVRSTDPRKTLLFRSGHFPEPNIIGHMMTSMTKHEGKPVYTIDQIQSDWGQKLRDGGVRDEAKIAELKKQLEQTPKPTEAEFDAWQELLPKSHSGRGWADQMPAMQERNRIFAELRTAEASAPGHPLVNTTDQWTTTTLRRAIRQAAEADAEYIAIPSGATVLSYNPGNTHGMQEFYGKIVPKNLKNILGKLDKDSPAPQRIETLDTPTSGAKGKGFTIFPLTEKVKASVKEDGQALFAMRSDPKDDTPERINTLVHTYQTAARGLVEAAGERGITAETLPDLMARAQELGIDNLDQLVAARTAVEAILGPERTDALVRAIAETIPMFPDKMPEIDPNSMTEAVSRFVADYLTPEPETPKVAKPEPANDNAVPTPLRQDLYDIRRMEDAAELVSVCRA